MEDSRNLAFLLAKADLLDTIDIQQAELRIGDKGLELDYRVEYRSGVIGPRKVALTQLWADMTRIRDAQIAGHMIRQGYLMVALEGGMVAVSPTGEEYQIHEDTCTCLDYLNKKRKCKHLMLRDWFLDHRRRANEYRQRKTKG